MKFTLTSLVFLSALTFAILAAAGNDPQLTIERIYDDPNLEGPSPRNLQFAPDGARVTFLKEKKENFKKLDLWEFEVANRTARRLVDSDTFLKGDENLSTEEKNRRERLRISDSGVVEYFWSENGKSLAFPIAGNIFYYGIGAQTGPVQVTKSSQHETDVQVSPLGNFVSYVRAGEVFATDVRKNKEFQLTRGARANVTHGLAEFIAQEEMDRYEGYWWSPDEKFLAFAEVDDSKVPNLRRVEILEGSFATVEQKYPLAGAANSRLRIGVYDLRSGKTKWLDLDKNTDIYVPRVRWFPDGQHLAVVLQSRDQRTLQLYAYDVLKNTRALLITETDPEWVPISEIEFLKKSNQFIWTSTRNGYRHLYLYENSGKISGAITRGPWDADFSGVNEDQGVVYVSGSTESPLERHLYAVPMGGGSPHRITKEEGWHSVTVARDGKSYTDVYSNPSRPRQVSLRSIDGSLLTWIEENALDRQHALTPYLSQLQKYEFGHFKTADGVELYYRLLKPRGFDAHKKYPAIVTTYGGPTSQLVKKSWSGKEGLWWQTLAAKGYVIFALDNRGTPGRGRDFNHASQMKLGQVEVEDQKAGVRHLVSMGFVDPKRVGVTGHSYGGYMTLMSMFKAPDTFAAGVAIAPVSDWRLYDTYYTERYLGRPQDNPDAYAQSNAAKFAGNLKGPLLIVHGMADDNVFFTNSTLVYRSLQDQGKLFEMMNYPGAKHILGDRKTQMHLKNAVTDFFDRRLK